LGRRRRSKKTGILTGGPAGLLKRRCHYNEFRVHQSLNGATPEEKGGGSTVTAVSLEHYDWQRHCHGFFQLPIAA
jgi:transposase InsO family protein